MSIFVKETDTVEVKIHYYEENGSIVVLDGPTDKTTTISVKFRRPDFSLSQRMVATSTTVDQTGSPAVNLLMLQNSMLYFLAKEWDIREPDVTEPEHKAADGTVIPAKVVPGKPVELNAENIGNLRVEIARAIVSKALPLIGQIL